MHCYKKVREAILGLWGRLKIFKWDLWDGHFIMDCTVHIHLLCMLFPCFLLQWLGYIIPIKYDPGFTVHFHTPLNPFYKGFFKVPIFFMVGIFRRLWTSALASTIINLSTLIADDSWIIFRFVMLTNGSFIIWCKGSQTGNGDPGNSSFMTVSFTVKNISLCSTFSNEYRGHNILQWCISDEGVTLTMIIPSLRLRALCVDRIAISPASW